MKNLKILFIGCGKMGGSLLKGMINADILIEEIDIVDPNISDDIKELISTNNINHYHDINEVKEISHQIIIVATKPDNFKEVFNGLEKNIIKENNTAVISILAGINLSMIESILGDIGVTRAMPNIAASVFNSMTALVGNKNLKSDQKKVIESIFNSVGQFVWLKKEEEIDLFTAFSGSGPAYFFYLTECLAEIAIEGGYSKESAYAISKQVLIGAGNLIKESELDPVKLRENVTSPNGTTEEAFKILNNQEKDFYNILKKAIRRAQQRSIEMN